MSEFIRRVKRNQKDLNSRLPYLDIELTERCNNNCIHCCINLPADDLIARGREMSTEQVKNLLNQAVNLGCLQVRFTGGEPLLRQDFEELYVFARRLGIKVLIFTNACLITQHIANLFACIPPLVEIEVTVYGMRAESYEAITRTPGSFSQFRYGVNLLLEHHIPFIVKGALLPQNINEIDEFETWAKTIPWMTSSPSYSMFFDLRNRRDNEKKNRLIESLRISPQEGLAILTRDEQNYREERIRFATKFIGPRDDTLFNCGAGHDLCIDAYGLIQPCMGLRMADLNYDSTGDNMAFSLQNALNHFSNLREIHSENPEYLRRCAICFLKSLCDQCPAKSWAEHGTLDTPVKYLCEITHVQARYLGLLNTDEWTWDIIDGKKRLSKFSCNEA